MLERAKQALVKAGLEPQWEAVFDANSYGFRPGRSCHDAKEVLDEATKAVTAWLENMGLILSPKKTRITHTLTPYEGNVGFDFLGFTVRPFPVGKTNTGKDSKGRPLGFKTLIKPSKEAVKEHTAETKKRIRQLRGAPQEKLIRELNPVIRGWANYYRTVVSARVYSECDNILYYQLVSWAKWRHPYLQEHGMDYGQILEAD